MGLGLTTSVKYLPGVGSVVSRDGIIGCLIGFAVGGGSSNRSE